MSASSTAPQNQSHTTMLVQAAEAGDFAVVYALIAAGVDVNSANEHGTTPLMAAAAHGHLAVVSFLLESGADLNARRLDAFDALALAVFYGHLDVVRELLARGANLKTDERLGTSVDTWATIRGFHDIAHVLTTGETIASAVTDKSERVPKALEVEEQPSSVASAYVSKPRYNFKRKSRKLTTRLASIISGSSRPAIDSSYIESTYVAKPRYRDKRKFRKLIKCLAYITSDRRRLTGLILIVMFVCGLSVVAVLDLFGSSKQSHVDTPVPISTASTPDNFSVNPQNDLQSGTQAEPIPTTPDISDAPAEDSKLAEKKSVAPLPKSSSEKVDRLHSKAAMTSKQEPQGAARSTPSAFPKIIASTNFLGAAGEVSSGAKASPPRLAKRPPNVESKRPRRVAGRDDQLAPATTSGRTTKAKVIQWP